MRLSRTLAALLLSVGLAAAARAQGGTTLVVGVADAESGVALENALVWLPDFGYHARTDAMGGARVRGVHAGRWAVEVRKLGYKPLRVELAFSGRDSLDAVLMLDRATETLDTVKVLAEAPAPAHLRDFSARRKLGIGRFRTRAELLSRYGDQSFADLLVAMFPGVMVERLGTRAVATSTRAGRQSLMATQGAPYLSDQVKPAKSGQPIKLPAPVRAPDPTTAATRGCPLRVYLDDQPLPDQDIGWLRTGDLAGVEFYSGDSAPVQYRRGSTCGVLLLWFNW